MAHTVSLTDSYQESSIFVLICQEVSETVNPVHFAKEPPDKDKVIIKISQWVCWKMTELRDLWSIPKIWIPRIVTNLENHRASAYNLQIPGVHKTPENYSFKELKLFFFAIVHLPIKKPCRCLSAAWSRGIQWRVYNLFQLCLTINTFNPGSFTQKHCKIKIRIIWRNHITNK